MPSRTLADALAHTLGAEIQSLTPVAGGDINQAFKVHVADGRVVFVKTRTGADPDMYQAEADGLVWLAAPHVLRVPSVLALSRGGTGHDPFLVLEHIPTGRRPPDFDRRLGHGLAALHRYGAACFGLDRDNFIGSLPQDNTPAPDWVAFLRDRRLEPQLRLAVDSGQASPRIRQGFARLFAHLEERVGPTEPPARLHGDLWAGNHMVADNGEPVLIDPAVYGGHREMDLAMMRLFGGYGPQVFSAYEEVFPLAPEAEQRVPLYQLYPLMVHLNLFGGSYGASVEAALARVI